MSHLVDSLSDRRAEALAMILLTRRHDLHVEGFPAPSEPFLLVRLAGRRNAHRRTLGVIPKGSPEPIRSSEQASSRLGTAIERKALHLPQLSMPICVFLFGGDDRGYFDWLLVPIASPDGASLEETREFAARPLDDEALKGMIAEVDRWYDALYRVKSRKARSSRPR